MTQDERQQMIIAAALPLLAEFGPTTTTAQIARAAGIGEATIFRAFPDKDTLLRACAAEVIRPDHVLRELASIDQDQPLHDRLVQAAEALSARMVRIGAVVGPLAAVLRNAEGPRAHPERSREESQAMTTAAVVELLEPDADRFRVPVERVARTFGYLVLTLGSGDGEGSANEVVALLLNGALKS